LRFLAYLSVGFGLPGVPSPSCRLLPPLHGSLPFALFFRSRTVWFYIVFRAGLRAAGCVCRRACCVAVSLLPLYDLFGSAVVRCIVRHAFLQLLLLLRGFLWLYWFGCLFTALPPSPPPACSCSRRFAVGTHHVHLNSGARVFAVRFCPGCAAAPHTCALVYATHRHHHLPPLPRRVPHRLFHQPTIQTSLGRDLRASTGTHHYIYPATAHCPAGYVADAHLRFCMTAPAFGWYPYCARLPWLRAACRAVLYTTVCLGSLLLFYFRCSHYAPAVFRFVPGRSSPTPAVIPYLTRVPITFCHLRIMVHCCRFLLVTYYRLRLLRCAVSLPQFHFPHISVAGPCLYQFGCTVLPWVWLLLCHAVYIAVPTYHCVF